MYIFSKDFFFFRWFGSGYSPEDNCMPKKPCPSFNSQFLDTQYMTTDSIFDILYVLEVLTHFIVQFDIWNGSRLFEHTVSGILYQNIIMQIFFFWSNPIRVYFIIWYCRFINWFSNPFVYTPCSTDVHKYALPHHLTLSQIISLFSSFSLILSAYFSHSLSIDPSFLPLFQFLSLSY